MTNARTMSSSISSEWSDEDSHLPLSSTAPSSFPQYGSVRATVLSSSPSMEGSPTLRTYTDQASSEQLLSTEPETSAQMRAVRDRLETAVILSLLRRKYRDRLLVCAYIALLVGLTPLSIYLLVQWQFFATFYLHYSDSIHLAVQVVNVVLLYLYIATAFHIGALFLAFNVNPLYGNLVVALSVGSLLAVEFVDQVSVYLRLAHFDDHGFYCPWPSLDLSPAATYGGTSPDNTLFIVMGFFALLAIFMALLNALHVLYYEVHYRNTLNAPLQFLETEEP